MYTATNSHFPPLEPTITLLLKITRQSKGGVHFRVNKRLSHDFPFNVPANWSSRLISKEDTIHFSFLNMFIKKVI